MPTAGVIEPAYTTSFLPPGWLLISWGLLIYINGARCNDLIDIWGVITTYHNIFNIQISQLIHWECMVIRCKLMILGITIYIIYLKMTCLMNKRVPTTVRHTIKTTLVITGPSLMFKYLNGGTVRLPDMSGFMAKTSSKYVEPHVNLYSSAKTYT